MNPRSSPEKTLLGEENTKTGTDKKAEVSLEPCVFFFEFFPAWVCAVYQSQTHILNKFGERRYIAVTKIDGKGQASKGQKSYKIVLIIRTFPFRNTPKSHVFKSYVVVRKRAPWLAIMFAKIVLHPIRNRSSAPVYPLSLFVAPSLRPFN